MYDRSSRLQMPPRVGPPVPLRLLRPGASIVHSLLPAFGPVSGTPSHRPSNENQDYRPSWLLPRFARRLKLAPWRSARSWTLHWYFQEQTENLPFFPNLTHHFSWFSCTFIIFSFVSWISSIVCRARQRDSLLAGAFEMSWWIDWLIIVPIMILTI